ncbi:hypothetical protein H4R18_005832 [Coemansia javaensis]|uniref:AAA-ATPase-like domain-containing protein n=1 Tax=Coemansia javaensis TaxID=2761396 RepID=A0A9W8H7D1_9FUNG|nr:hypothetical protein H4R18_005832 [Coemansia javaensis]
MMPPASDESAAKRRCCGPAEGQPRPIDWSLTRIYRGGLNDCSGLEPERGILLTMDRSLLCKAVLEAGPRAIRICGPESTGKTYGMEVLTELFNVVTRHDIPRNRGYYRHWQRNYPKFDYDEYRAGRVKNFEGSLLAREAPEFVDAHFARYPVLDVGSLGAHNRYLARAVSLTLNHWVNAFEADKLDAEQAKHHEALTAAHAEYKQDAEKDDDTFWAGRADAAARMFALLAEHLSAMLKSDYIVLVDNYDLPLARVQDQPWAEQARHSYMLLLRQILADNSRLVKAVLFGTRALPLGEDGGLDMDGMATVPLPIAGHDAPPRPAADPPQDRGLAAIPLFFGATIRDAVELLELGTEARRERQTARCAIRLALFHGAPTADMVDYCFGHDTAADGKRYRLADLRKFLEVWRVRSPRLTLRSHLWHEGVSADLLAMADERCADMIQLVSALQHNYDTHTVDDCIFRTGTPSLLRARTDASDAGALVVELAELGELSELAALAIRAGHLEVGPGGVLRIPNGRQRRVWEHVRLRATFGDAVPTDQYAERTKLVDSLHRGDASVLRSELQLCVSELLEPEWDYSEDVKLELACRYVVSILALPRYLAIDRSNVEYDHAFFRALHDGRASWDITLLPFGRYVRRLAVVLEFARILPEDPDDAAPLLAQRALQRIPVHGHAQRFARCDVRMDVGVAFGQGRVDTCHRVLKRAAGDAGSRDEPQWVVDDTRMEQD